MELTGKSQADLLENQSKMEENNKNSQISQEKDAEGKNYK